MLVLSRKKLESIVLDGGIVITVIEVKGSYCKLGIQAPRHIGIRRSEVTTAINESLPQPVPPTAERAM